MELLFYFNLCIVFIFKNMYLITIFKKLKQKWFKQEEEKLGVGSKEESS